MKSLSLRLGLVCFVVGLMICSAKVWGADWKEFAESTTGVFLYDTSSVAPPAPGLVKVWINNRAKNETNLVELNCNDKKYEVLSVVEWDEAYQIKSREDYPDDPTSEWLSISPGSVAEALSKVVCP